MAELMPEPQDGALVLVGEPLMGVVLVRDDHATREAGFTPDQHWCGVADDEAEPLSWAQVTGAEPDGGRLANVPRVVTRLYTEQELREAVAAVQLRVIGEHIVEPGGWCRRCDSQHSGPEVARLEDRLAEEEGERRG